MALNVVTLTASIKAAFVLGGADPTSPLLTALAGGLAAAIITEFTTNADVIPTTGVPPLTVAAAPGAVAGKGRIT
jgi:hypothetical protein